MKHNDSAAILARLVAALLVAMLATAGVGLAVCFSGCTGRINAEADHWRNVVTVARAVHEVATQQQAEKSQPAPGHPRSAPSEGDSAVGAGRVQYSTAPMVRRWTWTQAGRVDDPAALRERLSAGRFAGRFDRAWLDQLTQAELIALHSDGRENAVQVDCIVRPPLQTGSRGWRWETFCDGGKCYRRQVWD